MIDRRTFRTTVAFDLVGVPQAVKIPKGAKRADMPVEQATNFELILNLMTAKILGLAIPSPLRPRADEVIQ